jgi:drug/metabolite transporter (DMT)-like permease
MLLNPDLASLFSFLSARDKVLIGRLLQLMNIGLLYTPVSIYQMTRGALVLFVGILSVIFLHRRLWLYQ